MIMYVLNQIYRLEDCRNYELVTHSPNLALQLEHMHPAPGAHDV